MNRPRIIIKHRKARPFFARHPWVFANSIERVEGEPEIGSEVSVVSHEGVFIATGLYNPRSAIRVRLYRWEDQPLDEAYWTAKIDSALELRRDVLHLMDPGSACRLIFSESDGLSGLTVDRYDRVLVVQFTSLALYGRREFFVKALAERLDPSAVWLRTEKGIANAEGLQAESSIALGELREGPSLIVENGLTYEIDPRAGQKTGFFIDQRDNRLAVARYAKDRRVLDLFCHGGGFALNALKHGNASSAIGIDRSESAIAAAVRNAEINGFADRAGFQVADAFDVIQQFRATGERFGLVICDPPKFSRKSTDVEDALKGYIRLNRAAIDVLTPGGILATCSCSGNVDRELFSEMLGQVAEHSGKSIQLLEIRGQAADHPVSASCLETEYLKCVIARVG